MKAIYGVVALLAITISAWALPPYAYVANETYTVPVINWQTRSVVDEIAIPHHGNPAFGVAAIAVNPNGLFVYALNDGDSELDVIETGAGTVIATIPLELVEPDAIGVTPDGKRVWVKSSVQGKIDVICAIANVLLDQFSVRGEFSQKTPILFSPDGKYAYVVSLLDGGYISVLSTGSQQTVRTIPLPAGVPPVAPHDIILSPDGTYFYFRQGFGIEALPVAAGGTPTTIPLPFFFVGQLAITADGKFIYVVDSNGEAVDSLFVICLANKSVVKQVPIASVFSEVWLTPNAQYALISGAIQAVYAVSTSTWATSPTPVLDTTALDMVFLPLHPIPKW